jgi:Tol biopolymer transport system component/predicted Ser/Thr protein kinase
MIGENILHYKILVKLGEGGMGTVYKAQDTKLDRFVALKFLPSQLTATDDEKARFVQEAKAASAMNHPNVCTIYDINDYNGQLFIVMEFVDGKTLKEKKDNLSEKQILEIGIQVSEGLAAAHEKGIVHRDIKPDNIMIRKDGIVQILDFGLAKLYKEGNVSRLTKVGTTMGTIGYMSPEQVQGLDVDHRTDLFSLGVVLYEMLTGEPPFKGVHETAVMYEIVNVDPPPLSTIKEGITPELDEIVLECLEKDKDERCQSAKELAKDLRKIKKSTGTRKSKIFNVNPSIINTRSQQLQSSNSIETVLKKNITRKFNLNKIILSASFLIVLIIAVLAAWTLHPDPPKEVRKFQWPYEYDVCILSPDGKKIAYSKKEKLWIRRLDKIEPVEIKNEDPISNIIWSPKSDYIAYFTGIETDKHELRKVSINGMENSLIVNTAGNYYPRFWGSDDSILVNTWDNKGFNVMLKVPSSGGDLKPICGGDSVLSTISGNLTHALELPDGKSILICNNLAAGRGEIFVQTHNKRTLIYSGPAQSNIGRPVYSNSGHILFPLTTRTNSLPDIWAIPFDPSSLKISGNPFLIARNADQISVSGNGMLFYVEQENYSKGVQLVLLSRSGKLLKNISQPQLEIFSPAVSPDGNIVAATGLNDRGTYDIWLHDLIKGTKSQLTYDIPLTWKPSWSPDGKQIVFQSGYFDSTVIYTIPANGLAPAKPIMHSNEFVSGPSWSPDGRFIFYSKLETKLSKQNDIWYYDFNNGGTSKPLFESRFNEDIPCSSPDGKYIAFESDKSGQMEIYVTNFPKADQQWQVSSDGGSLPQWIGNEIFFTSQKGNSLMSVKVKTTPDFLAGVPEKLFSVDSAEVQLLSFWSSLYAVTGDGKNIVTVKSMAGSSPKKMVLVENWTEELKDNK